MGQANQYTINSCGIYDCNTAWRWNSKGSRDYNLWAVFRGEGTLSLFGTSYSALTGTCFLIPPQTPTNGTHNPNSRLFVYSVHFSTNGVSIPLDSKRIPNVPFFKELFDRVIRFYNMNRSELAQTYLEVLLNEFFTAPDTPSNKQTPENISHRRCVT